jgi:SPP1 family predicted phage head-tail adaptor
MQLQQFPHRVTIQLKESTKNDFSEQVETWVDVLTNIYADVRNLSGRETKDNDQTQNFITISVRIRNRPNIDDDMRIVHAGRKLRILAILPDQTSAYLDIKCEAWTDAK